MTLWLHEYFLFKQTKIKGTKEFYFKKCSKQTLLVALRNSWRNQGLGYFVSVHKYAILIQFWIKKNWVDEFNDIELITASVIAWILVKGIKLIAVNVMAWMAEFNIKTSQHK